MDILLTKEQIRVAKEGVEQQKRRLAVAYREFVIEFRRRRQEKGLSLRDCAKQMKLSTSYLSDVELLRRNPNETILNFFK